MAFSVNEGSTFCLTITLTDSDGDALTPIDGLTWWVTKPKATEPILEEQTVTSPTASTEIVVPASAHVCSGTRDESRVLIVKVVSGASHVKHEAFEYTVTALDTVPYPEDEG